MRRLFIILLSATLLYGCVYPFDIEGGYGSDYDGDEKDIPIVVEGNICIGGESVVTLSRLGGIGNYIVSGGLGYISGASVMVQDNIGLVYKATEERGKYLINIPSSKKNRLYRLVVKVDGNTYVSDYQEPLDAPKISGISASATMDWVIVNISIQSGNSDANYVAVRYSEAWKFHADYIRMYDYDPNKDEIAVVTNPDLSHYYCWMTNTFTNDLLVNLSETNGKVEGMSLTRFARTDNRLQCGEYYLKPTVRALSEEEYRYRVQMNKNSSQTGDLFSPNPGELPSNVTCENDPSRKVYGYVNIGRASSTMLKLDDQYYIQPNPAYLTILEPENYLNYYFKGFLPVADYVTLEASGIGWGKDRCYDCIAAGGRLEKPSMVP